MIHRPYVFLDYPITRLSSKSPSGVGLRQNRQRLDSHRGFFRDNKAKEPDKKQTKGNKTVLTFENNYEKENANPEVTSKEKKVSSKKCLKVKQFCAKQNARAVSALKSTKMEKLHMKCNEIKEGGDNVVPVNRLLEMLKGIVSGKDPCNIPQSTKGHSKPILKEDPMQEKKLLKTEYNDCISKVIKEVNIEINSKQTKPAHENKHESKNCLSGTFADSLSHLLVGKQIGQGAYASVRIAFNKNLGHKVALKIYEKAKLMEPQRQYNMQNEMKILKKLNHPNIVKLYSAFDTRRHVVLEMEVVKGTSLHGFLKSKDKRRIDEPEAKRLFGQILNGIEHCHSNNVAHRDIKLENLLLDENENIKIIDFGFSTCMPVQKRIRIFCGTPSYMSPEIVTRKEYAGPPADIWALGVLLYAMLCGTFPFKGSTDKELYRRISHGLYSLPSYLSSASKALISKILTVDPDRRPTVYEILKDAWLLPSITNIQFGQIPSSTKNRPINMEAKEAYSGFFCVKPKKLMVEISNPKVPRNVYPETTVNKNIAQMNFRFMPKPEDSSQEETLDKDLLTSIARLGYSIEEVEKEIKNKNSYIRSIYDKYAKQRRAQKVMPGLSIEKAKTPKANDSTIGFGKSGTSINISSSRGIKKPIFR